MNEKIIVGIIRKELEGIKNGLQVLGTKQGQLTVVEAMLVMADRLGNFRGDKGETGERGSDGKDGDTGPQGYTPLKGKDYYTEEDVRAVVSLVYSKIVLPKAGKDFYTEADKKKILVELKKHMPKVGKDFYTVAEKKNFIKQITGLMKANVVTINRSIEDVKKEAGDRFIIGQGVRKITVSKAQPENPVEGDLWIESK